MFCGGCAARVTRAIQTLDPVAKVEVLLKDSLVRVKSVESPEAIAGAITSAGYPATQAT
jgi:copper chaperone